VQKKKRSWHGIFPQTSRPQKKNVFVLLSENERRQNTFTPKKETELTTTRVNFEGPMKIFGNTKHILLHEACWQERKKRNLRLGQKCLRVGILQT